MLAEIPKEPDHTLTDEEIFQVKDDDCKPAFYICRIRARYNDEKKMGGVNFTKHTGLGANQD